MDPFTYLLATSGFLPGADPLLPLGEVRCLDGLQSNFEVWGCFCMGYSPWIHLNRV